MAKVVINPRIENCIRHINYKTYAGASADKQEELARWYENGDLLVLTNYKFSAGAAVFREILFPNEKRAKKIMLHTHEMDHGEPPRAFEWSVVDELLGRETEKIERFRTAVTEANAELSRIVDTLFPRYHYLKRLCIYNLSEMLGHNLHFDSPQHADTHTQLRAFVNLDDYPRIWHVGRRLETEADEHYHSAGMIDVAGRHPREFTRKLTHATFGDRYDSGTHRHPKHTLAFQGGEVWFLNPNMTAHEIVYGRRLLDGVFLFDQADLVDQSRFLPNIVEALHKKHVGTVRYRARRLVRRLGSLLPRK